MWLKESHFLRLQKTLTVELKSALRLLISCRRSSVREAWIPGEQRVGVNVITETFRKVLRIVLRCRKKLSKFSLKSLQNRFGDNEVLVSEM